MVDYIKKKGLLLLLFGTIIFTVLRIWIPFIGGYRGNFLDIYFISTEPLRYICITIYIIFSIKSKLNQKRKSAFVLVAVLIGLGLIPTGHFMTFGALLSMYNAGPEQIRADARTLMEKYDKNAYFSDLKNQRFFMSEPIPKSELPLSLQNENINDVLVLENYVFLEKFGMRGLFRGFIVFREGSDIWKNEKSFVFLDNCSHCWRIRVIDSLYWYHAVPIEEEVATVAYPLK